MAEVVTSVRNFLEQLQKLKGRHNLFAIILCDEKSTNESIIEFFSERGEWLTSLANASKVTVFICNRSKPQPRAKGRQKSAAKNPSLEIANMFKIRVDQLPAIVFFTLSEFSRKGTGVFLPLDPQKFKQDHEEAEQFISQVFGVIQKCQSDKKGKQTLLSKIRAEMQKLSNKEKMKPVLKYLRQNIRSTGIVSTTFFENLAQALGVAIAGLVAKGSGQ